MLGIAFYNLCRVHESLRCTPAMALGTTDHIWTIGELVQAALEPQDVPPLPDRTPQSTLKLGYTPLKLRVIPAEKSRVLDKNGFDLSTQKRIKYELNTLTKYSR